MSLKALNDTRAHTIGCRWVGEHLTHHVRTGHEICAQICKHQIFSSRNLNDCRHAIRTRDTGTLREKSSRFCNRFCFLFRRICRSSLSTEKLPSVARYSSKSTTRSSASSIPLWNRSKPSLQRSKRFWSTNRRNVFSRVTSSSSAEIFLRRNRFNCATSSREPSSTSQSKTVSKA